MLFPAPPLFCLCRWFWMSDLFLSWAAVSQAGQGLPSAAPLMQPSKTSADLQFPVPDCHTKDGEESLPCAPVLKPLIALKCHQPALRYFVSALSLQCHSCHPFLFGVRCLSRCQCPGAAEPQVLCHFPGKHVGYAAAPAPFLLCSGRTRSFLAEPQILLLSA